MYNDSGYYKATWWPPSTEGGYYVTIKVEYNVGTTAFIYKVVTLEDL